MTKREISSELEDLQADLLGGLDPTERLPLFLEGLSAEKTAHLTQLRETCPSVTYRGLDRAFVDRARYAMLFADRFVYKLHTTALHFELLELQQTSRWVIDHYRDDDSSEEVLERAAERGDELTGLFAEIYTQYHAYGRFAESVLGVDLATLVDRHPEGTAVLATVEDVLANTVREDLADEWAAEVFDGDMEDEETPSTLEDLVQIRLDGLTEAWESAIDDLPAPVES